MPDGRATRFDMMTAMEGPAASHHPDAADPAAVEPAAVEPAAAPDRETETRAVLAELGTAMIATGQPVQEIEEELAEVSARLGYPDVQSAVGPTGLMLTLTPGGPSTYRSAVGGLRLHQAASVRLIRHQLLEGELTRAAVRTPSAMASAMSTCATPRCRAQRSSSSEP